MMLRPRDGAVRGERFREEPDDCDDSDYRGRETVVLEVEIERG